MQLRLSLVTILVFSGVVAGSAFVWTAKAAPKNKDSAQRVELVPDQEHGVLRVVIDDKEIARFDSTGFYVHGDIAYSGTISDGLPLEKVIPGAR